MNSINEKDHHLNLFYFYGRQENRYLENNLTRGLAICLENDPILFDRFLREVLGKHHKDLFKTEGRDTKVNINVQERAKNFVGIKTVYGVPLTTSELAIEADTEPRGAEDPITDLSIQIDDKLILVEVKKTADDCREQLKNQIVKINEDTDEQVVLKVVQEFSWGKLMEIIRLSINYEDNVNASNLFINDYYNFIKRRFPQWFENIPFNQIHFPDILSKDLKSKELIEVRLNVIKNEILQLRNEESGREDELVFNRANIPVHEYGWVDEINIEPGQDEETEKNYIALKVWPGDTKAQGLKIYKHNKAFEWPDYIYQKNYKFIVKPYIKFSHMQGLCWVWFGDKTNTTIHKRDFFSKYAGKWSRNEIDVWVKRNQSWEAFDKIVSLENQYGKDWKKESEWIKKIDDTQRSFFYVSLGLAIEVRVPYEVIQKLDRTNIDGTNQLVIEMKEVSDSLLQELARQFSK